MHWARRADLRFALPFLALLTCALCVQIAVHDGWPLNHEWINWKIRLLILAAHFKRGDLLPVWSEAAPQGFGSPLPLLYHKLFNLLAVPVFAISGSVKFAILASMCGFSLLGVLGVQSLLRYWGVEKRAALVSASAFCLCNYAYTNWVVRGAFAEYSAMMLLPWLLRWLWTVVDGRPVRGLWWPGAVILPALYLAHSLIFFLAAVPVLIAVVWRLCVSSDRKAFLVLLLRIGAVFAVVVGPILIGQRAVLPDLNFEAGISQFVPTERYSSLNDHLTGGAFIWGQKHEVHSVQLDVALVALAVFLGAALLWVRIAGKITGKPRVAPTVTPSYRYCWTLVPYFAFLMSPVSAFVYRKVPGFWAIQFPWRALTYSSLLSVVLAAYPWLSWLRIGRERGERAAAWTLLALVGLGSPFLHTINYEWYPGDWVAGPLPPTSQIFVGGIEYHPKMSGHAGVWLFDHFARLEPRPDAQSWNAAGYSVARLDEPALEKGARVYQVHAALPTAVTLPLSYSPFIHVDSVHDGHGERAATYRLSQEPLVHVDVPAGDTELRVQFPSFWSLFVDIVTGTAARR
jgi:hypothetical protein